MQDSLLTPEKIACPFPMVSIPEGKYDWESQTVKYPNELDVPMMCSTLWNDTNSTTFSGVAQFSDDSDKD